MPGLEGSGTSFAIIHQVTGAMVAGVQKISDGCVESVKTGKPVNLSWEEAEIPADYKSESFFF